MHKRVTASGRACPNENCFNLEIMRLLLRPFFSQNNGMLLGGQTTDLIMHEHLLSDSEILSFAAIS